MSGTKKLGGSDLLDFEEEDDDDSVSSVSTDYDRYKTVRDSFDNYKQKLDLVNVINLSLSNMHSINNKIKLIVEW